MSIHLKNRWTVSPPIAGLLLSLFVSVPFQNPIGHNIISRESAITASSEGSEGGRARRAACHLCNGTIFERWGERWGAHAALRGAQPT